MATILLEPHFLPTLEFYCALMPFEHIRFEQHEHFVKQTFRNHTVVRGANRVEKLVVPLSVKGHRVPLREVKMEPGLRWRNNHWRTIVSAYRKSPYFEHYAPELERCFFEPSGQLVAFNIKLFALSLKWLRWQKEISLTSNFEKTPDQISDFRNVVLSKRPFLERMIYSPQPYTQVFGSDFEPNLSILDVIFCKGPEAALLLKTSATSRPA